MRTPKPSDLADMKTSSSFMQDLARSRLELLAKMLDGAGMSRTHAATSMHRLINDPDALARTTIGEYRDLTLSVIDLLENSGETPR